MYEKLKAKLVKEKRKEIERIERWERELAKQKEFMDSLEIHGIRTPQNSDFWPMSTLERLKKVALNEGLPDAFDCEWFRSSHTRYRDGSVSLISSRCLHSLHPTRLGGCPLESDWIEWHQYLGEIGPSPTLEELCPFFEPDYYLRVIGKRNAEKEILRKLAAQHFFILRGGWAREIILGILRYHGDIDIFVIEDQWKELRDHLEKEGFKIEAKRGEILAKRGLVTIDIALVIEEENHFIKDVYIDNSFYGQLCFPKNGFEKQDIFTVMSLELDWLSLGLERRTKKAEKLAKFLNQQKLKELDREFYFKPEPLPEYRNPPFPIYWDGEEWKWRLGKPSLIAELTGKVPEAYY